MPKRVVLLSLIAGICLAASFAEADTAPPGPTPTPTPPRPVPIPAPAAVKPWNERAKEALDAHVIPRLPKCKTDNNGASGSGKVMIVAVGHGGIQGSKTDFVAGPYKKGTPMGDCILGAVNTTAVTMFDPATATRELGYGFVVP